MPSLHIEVRWLSSRKSLNKVFELREPLQRFVLKNESHLADNNFSSKKMGPQAFLSAYLSIAVQDSHRLSVD